MGVSWSIGSCDNCFTNKTDKRHRTANLPILLGSVSAGAILSLLVLVGVYVYLNKLADRKLAAQGWYRMPESASNAALSGKGGGQGTIHNNKSMRSVGEWRDAQEGQDVEGGMGYRQPGFGGSGVTIVGLGRSDSDGSGMTGKSGESGTSSKSELAEVSEVSDGSRLSRVPSYIPYKPPSSGGQGLGRNGHAHPIRPLASPGYIPYTGPVERMPPTMIKGTDSAREWLESTNTALGRRTSGHSVGSGARSLVDSRGLTGETDTGAGNGGIVTRPPASRQNSNNSRRSDRNRDVINNVPLDDHDYPSAEGMTPMSYQSSLTPTPTAGGAGSAFGSRSRSRSHARISNPLSAISSVSIDNALIRTASKAGQRSVARLWPSRAAVPSDYLASTLERYHGEGETYMSTDAPGAPGEVRQGGGMGGGKLPPSAYRHEGVKGERLSITINGNGNGNGGEDIQAVLRYIASQSQSQSQSPSEGLTVPPGNETYASSAVLPRSRHDSSSGEGNGSYLPSSSNSNSHTRSMASGLASSAALPSALQTSSSSRAQSSTNTPSHTAQPSPASPSPLSAYALRRGVSVKSVKTIRSYFSFLGLDSLSGPYTSNEPLPAGVNANGTLPPGSALVPRSAARPDSGAFPFSLISIGGPTRGAGAGVTRTSTDDVESGLRRKGSMRDERHGGPPLRIQVPPQGPPAPGRDWVIELDPNSPMTSVSRPMSTYRGW